MEIAPRDRRAGALLIVNMFGRTHNELFGALVMVEYDKMFRRLRERVHLLGGLIAEIHEIHFAAVEPLPAARPRGRRECRLRRFQIFFQAA